MLGAARSRALLVLIAATAVLDACGAKTSKPEVVIPVSSRAAERTAHVTELSTGPIHDVTVSPRGDLAAIARTRSLELVRLPEWTRVWKVPVACEIMNFPLATFSPDASSFTCVTSSRQELVALDVGTGEVRRRWALEMPQRPPGPAAAQGSGVTAHEEMLALVPTAALAVSAASAPPSLTIISTTQVRDVVPSAGDRATAIPRRAWKNGAIPRSAQDARSVWYARDASLIRLGAESPHNAADGPGAAELRLPCPSVTFAIDPARDRAAAACLNKREVALVRLSTGEVLASHAVPSETVKDVALTPAGAIVVTNSPARLGRLPESGPAIWEAMSAPGHVAVAMSPSGGRAAGVGNGGELQVIGLPGGEVLCDHGVLGARFAIGAGFGGEDELWVITRGFFALPFHPQIKGPSDLSAATELVRVRLGPLGEPSTPAKCEVDQRTELRHFIWSATWLQRPRAFAVRADGSPEGDSGAYLLPVTAPSKWRRIGAGYMPGVIAASADGARIATVAPPRAELFDVRDGVRAAGALEDVGELALCEGGVAAVRYGERAVWIYDRDGKAVARAEPIGPHALYCVGRGFAAVEVNAGVLSLFGVSDMGRSSSWSPARPWSLEAQIRLPGLGLLTVTPSQRAFLTSMGDGGFHLVTLD